MKRQGVLPFSPVPSAPPSLPVTYAQALPAGAIPKLQMLENIIRCSPSILHEDARETFLALVWLALAELGSLPPGARKAA